MLGGPDNLDDIKIENSMIVNLNLTQDHFSFYFNEISVKYKLLLYYNIINITYIKGLII